jgi:uncharacterized protein YgiM (DUF1202 family)
MPAGAKICRKCQAKRDAQRAQQLETLPKPIRPEETKSSVQTEELKKTASRSEETVQATATRTKESTRSSRPVEIPTEKTPKPVETARRPASSTASRSSRKKNSNIGQLVGVLAVILVVIVVAVVLVIKMNKTDPVETSETYDGVRLITSDGEDITPTQPPVADTQDEDAQDEDETETQDETEAVIPSEVDPESEDEAQDEEEIEQSYPSETVYVTGSGVNLRSGPSTTYEVLASLTRGTELTRTDTLDGWSQVEYEGQVGYVSNTLLSTEDPTGKADDNSTESDDTADDKTETETTTADDKTETETSTADDTTTTTTTTTTDAATDTVTVKAKANIRTGPGTNYTSVAILPVGTELERISVSGNWSKVIYNGQELYIHNNMISAASTTTSTTTSVSVTASSGTLTIASKANIRSGPGTSFAILGVVDVGTTLDITGVTNTNWYQVTYNGQTGFVAGNLITKN